MKKFTEDEVKQIFKLAEKDDNFSPATNRSCMGTLFSLDRMETLGVKLVVSPLGKRDELESINVCDFIDSPCVWIGENGTGRWVGLQGGWPVDEKKRQEELEYDSAVIRRNRNHYPDPEIDRPVEFMNLARDKSSYLIPRPGWFALAKKRINLYKSLRESWPESLAAKIAKEVEFNYHGEPKFKKLALGYIGQVSVVFIKLLIILSAIFGLINIL